jgi:hypothetical protein
MMCKVNYDTISHGVKSQSPRFGGFNRVIKRLCAGIVGDRDAERASAGIFRLTHAAEFP